MGTRKHHRLGLWMNGLLVGHWEHAKGEDRLQYDAGWVQDADGRPLSLSLPFTHGNAPLRGGVVTAYFDNLLPDSAQIRQRIAQRYRLSTDHPFDLLGAIGNDCVGALQILPQGEAPANVYQIDGAPLGTADVAQILRDTVVARPLGQRDELSDHFRISIAGAQEKTALLWQDCHWAEPRGSTPTTHIFKLPLGLVGGMQADMRNSVENEWLCSKILQEYGIPVASCSIGTFEDQKALIVERFDRRHMADEEGGWIARLPQEDFCQATATPPHLKYQTEGGPGIKTIMDILLQSANATLDRYHFFKAQVVFWLLAATDGHAKNFSLAIRAGGHYALTPLYDVLSAHPIIGTGANQIARQKARLAMGVRGSEIHYQIDRIQRRHWFSQAQQANLPADTVTQMLEELLASTDAVIQGVEAALPAGFPTDMAEAIFAGMRRQRDRLTATA